MILYLIKSFEKETKLVKLRSSISVLTQIALSEKLGRALFQLPADGLKCMNHPVKMKVKEGGPAKPGGGESSRVTEVQGLQRGKTGSFRSP